MKKKIVSLVLVFAMALALGIGGTIAWLTASTAEVVNTFTVGNIDITLAESDNLDFKMVPGKTIAKDPKATVVAGSEACWLFVKITESNNLDSFISYNVADGWTALDGADGVYWREVTKDKIGTAFSVLSGDQVTVLNTVTKADMDGLKAAGATQPTLTFKAYAVQRENIDNAATAWDAIPAEQKN